MIDFQSYDDVERWARRHGTEALKNLLRTETMRSNSQSLAAIWLARRERIGAAAGTRRDRGREGPDSRGR